MSVNNRQDMEGGGNNDKTCAKPCLQVIYPGIVTVAFVVVIGLEIFRSYEVSHMQREIQMLKRKVDLVTDLTFGGFSSTEEEVLQAPHRQRRQTSGQTDDGVDILEQPYGVPLNERPDSEGLRLYEGLISSQGQGEPQSSEYIQESAGPAILPHHRQSSVFRPENRNQYSNINTNPQFSNEVTYRRGSGTSPQLLGYRPTTSVPPTMPVLERRSRVKVTGDRPVRQRPQLRNLGPQEFRAPRTELTSWDAEEREGRRRNLRRGRPKKARRHKNRHGGQETLEVTLRDLYLPSVSAVHLMGDTSNYTINHDSYKGNGLLENEGGVFIDWSPASWVDQMGYDSLYKLNQGSLSVTEEGLYFVYAQVHYLEEHDINGFQIHHNGRPFIQCTAMTTTTHKRLEKINSCYTGAAIYLQQDEQLAVVDIEPTRFSVLRPEKSFFGIIKLGGPKSRF